MIIQLCGLSGAGKTTLAQQVRKKLIELNIPSEIIDGDEYRQQVTRHLGFSREDRMENIRTLGFIASKFSAQGVLAIISAINPFEKARVELKKKYPGVKIVFIDCSLEELKKRDTKGLYRRAGLPELHPDKISNLSGVNDPFEVPAHPDLVIHTEQEPIEASAARLLSFILENRK